MTGEIDNSLPFESQTGEPLCMSRIAIVRHGEFGVDNRLNKRGRAQMKKIARQIRESLDKGEKALILTSPADRAFDSAKVISGILKVPIEDHEVLWSEDHRPTDLSTAYQVIHSVKNKADLLVVVTHLEYLKSLPNYLGLMDLDMPYEEESIEIGKGVLLDYRSGNLYFLGER